MVVADGLHLSAKTLGSLLVPFIDAVFSGKDSITGSVRGDNLYGGMQDDSISGLEGNDTLFGGKGDDKLRGGSASDTFQFGQFNDRDTILDFDAIGGGIRQDHLELFGEIKSIKQSGADLVIDLGGGDTLTLLDVDKHDFTKGDDYTI